MTRPDFGKGGVSRRIVCAGLPVLALLAAGGAWAGDPGIHPPLSIGRANEIVRFPPDLCRDLGFVRGTAELSASTPPAIAGMQQQWIQASADRNFVLMVVRVETGPARDQAVSLATKRAVALRSALGQSGIALDKVFVWPSSIKAKATKLSCPPVD